MTTATPRLLVVLPSLAFGGAEVQTVNLVNGLARSGVDVTLFVFESHRDLLPRIDRARVRVEFGRRRFKLDLYPAQQLAALVDELQPDVLYCCLQMALLYGWLARRLSRGRPMLVVAIHTTLNRSLKYDILDSVLYQWLMRDASRVVCVCRSQAEHWAAKFPALAGKFVVIYNGVDVARFDRACLDPGPDQVRKSLGMSGARPVFVTVARFRPEKGHGVLISAFAEVVARMPDARLVLVGDGPLLERTRADVVARGIDSQVVFVGAQTDVRSYITAAHVLVVPSTAETFPMAILEALALQCPVIATEVGGTAEIIQPDKNGALVPPGNSGALAEAMLTYGANLERLDIMGRAGRIGVTERFSEDVMVAKARTLFENCAR